MRNRFMFKKGFITILVLLIVIGVLAFVCFFTSCSDGIRYNLEYQAGEGGRIIGETSQTIEHGESGSEVTAAPDEGYEFVRWSDGLTVKTRTERGITDNITLKAEFVKKTYIIKYEAGEGGRIIGKTSQTIEYGENGSKVTATPDEGYEFVRWSDGLTVKTRTERGITDDITLKAEFKRFHVIKYSLWPGQGAELIGETEQRVIEGEDGKPVEVVITEPGYRFFGWREIGGDADERDVSYIKLEKNVHKSICYEALVNGPYYCDMIFSALEGGRIEGNLKQRVLYGEDGDPVVAIPSEGYCFTGWSDGEEEALRLNRNVVSYGGQPTIYANFERYERKFRFEYNGGRSVSGTRGEILLNLDNLATTKLPVPIRNGYVFEGWYSDWHFSTNFSDEEGNIIISREKFQNEFYFSEEHNPQKYLYAKWRNTQECPTFRVLMVFVTEVHALLKTEKYILDYSKSPVEFTTLSEEYIQVDYVMSETERKVCELIAVNMEQYLNAALKANVNFVVDTYFTTQPLAEENLLRGSQSFPYGDEGFKYLVRTDYATESSCIPEVKDLARGYRSVLTTICLNDDQSKLHLAAGSAGVREGHLYLETFRWVDFDDLFEDEELLYRFIRNTMGLYIHEFCHTIERQIADISYGIHNAHKHYTETVSVAHDEFNVVVPFLRNQYIIDDICVGIPFEFWLDE